MPQANSLCEPVSSIEKKHISYAKTKQNKKRLLFAESLIVEHVKRQMTTYAQQNLRTFERHSAFCSSGLQTNRVTHSIHLISLWLSLN